MTNEEELFQKWLGHRRGERPEVGFSDRVMEAVVSDELAGRRWLLASVVVRLAASRRGRAALCLAALLAGVTPYLFAFVGLFVL